MDLPRSTALSVPTSRRPISATPSSRRRIILVRLDMAMETVSFVVGDHGDAVLATPNSVATGASVEQFDVASARAETGRIIRHGTNAGVDVDEV